MLPGNLKVSHLRFTRKDWYRNPLRLKEVALLALVGRHFVVSKLHFVV